MIASDRSNPEDATIHLSLACTCPLQGRWLPLADKLAPPSAAASSCFQAPKGIHVVRSTDQPRILQRSMKVGRLGKGGDFEAQRWGQTSSIASRCSGSLTVLFECTSSIARLLTGPIVSANLWTQNKSAEKLAFEIFALYVFFRLEMIDVVRIVLQHVYTSEPIVCTLQSGSHACIFTATVN
jgi:Na+/H+ antiporter NhaA